MQERHFSARRSAQILFTLFAALAFLALHAPTARAAAWNGIEPLVSRRADVERVMSAIRAQPVTEAGASGIAGGGEGTMRFRVQGGTVAIAFVNAQQVRARRLDPSLEGTVWQIALQHENSSDTPESLRLASAPGFEREARGNVIIYSNTRDGMVYTFMDGHLRTTWYSASAGQLTRTRRRG